MLVGNLNNNLKKGFLCIFFLVPFQEVGMVEIQGETWIKRNRDGQKIRGMTQFFIALANAVTHHKS